MVEVNFILELVKGAKELADFARVQPGPDRDHLDERYTKELIEALRLIYFTPFGVLALLDEIAEGRTPTKEQVESILPRFNDGEPFVERMRVRLDPEIGHPKRVLTLKAERILRDISNEKEGVRRRVQFLLNESLTYGEEISPEDARELRKEIQNLNRAIEEAEEALAISLRR